MKALVLVLFLLVGVASIGQSFEMSTFIEKEKSGVVEGTVLDKSADNEPLIFATVTVKELNQQVETGFDGSYSIALKPGKYTLEFSFIGYAKVEVKNVLVTSSSKSIYDQALDVLSLNTNNNSLAQIDNK